MDISKESVVPRPSIHSYKSALSVDARTQTGKDLDAKGIALLREIFPGQSDEELLRLHRHRLETAAVQSPTGGPTSKLGQRIWKQAVILHRVEEQGEALHWKEHDLPDDFLRLPDEVAIRHFNEARGKWESHSVVDMENHVLKQHKSHQEIVGSMSLYPVDDLHYSCSLHRDPELGLGITLCEQAGCIWVHSMVGKCELRISRTPTESEKGGMRLPDAIRPGDWLLGVQGQALLPSHNGGNLLKYAVSAIKNTPDPVVLHLRHVSQHKFHQLVGRSEPSPLYSGPSLLDMTFEATDDSFVSEDLGSEPDCEADGEEAAPLVHPFVTALVSKGLIKTMEAQMEATECLKMYTRRTRQWESTSSFRIEAETFRLRHHFDPRDLPLPPLAETPTFCDDEARSIHAYAPSTPSLDPNTSRMPPHFMNNRTGVAADGEKSDDLRGVHLEGYSPKRLVLSYPGDRHRQQQQHSLQSLGGSDIVIPLLGVRKALCVRILSTFLEENRTAYTIWVYDVESGREWYAPVRYLRDFQDLRSSTIPLCAAISEISFPPISGWIAFGKSEKTDSASVRDSKRRQLESFLRRLCTMIYSDPLHPNIAEVAIHVQSFLGCDIGLSDVADPHLHLQNQVVTESMWGQRAEDGHSDLQMKVRLLLKRSIQRYTYRLFLLDCTKRIVDEFVDTVRANGPRLNDIEELQAQGRNVLKQKAMADLEKIQGFLDQLQDLIVDGCMPDFESIAGRRDFLSLHPFINGKKGAAYSDRLIRDAVREQIEIEVYVPLRGVMSRLLVNGWRHDDIEMQFKIQELRRRPQSFFKIPRKQQSPSYWASVSRIMKEGIGVSTLPCAKLRAIVDAAKEITRLYIHERDTTQIIHIQEEGSWTAEGDGLRSSALSADDFLPIFIFAVVRAELERPSALCVLLRTLCDRTGRIGETGYYLASFEAAIMHIQEINLAEEQEATGISSIQPSSPRSR